MKEKKISPNKATEKKELTTKEYAPLADILSALDALEISLGYEARPADEFKPLIHPNHSPPCP